MKNRHFILFILLGIFSVIHAQDYHVRIGTIGNSITQGTGLPNPLTQAYPVQLGVLLQDIYGDTCIVKNFGLTTTTMLKNGDVSYWDTQQLKDYLAYAPEICFIMLGTNDTKPQNWDAYGDEYIGDYLAMIDTIKARNPYTKFMLAYPPPAFEIRYDIRDSIIVHGIIPGVDSVLKVVEAELMDFYHPLLDSVHLFPDYIHPNAYGAGILAQMIADRMVETDIVHKAETGLTFITSYKTQTTPLAVGDSTELSWTSINADSVMLNGEKVEESGSLIVSPPETTLYTLLAMGVKSNDSLQIEQIMYTPELARLRIYPPKVTRYEGDTVLFTVYYHDQMDNLINNTTFPVTWEVADGSGYLFDETDVSVYFVAESADTSELQVSLGDISNTAIIITRAAVTGLQERSHGSELLIYPNPSGDILNLQINAITEPVAIKISDMKGQQCMARTYTPSASGEQIISIRVGHLPAGDYILNLEHAGNSYSGRFVILRN